VIWPEWAHEKINYRTQDSPDRFMVEFQAPQGAAQHLVRPAIAERKQGKDEVI